MLEWISVLLGTMSKRDPLSFHYLGTQRESVISVRKLSSPVNLALLFNVLVSMPERNKFLLFINYRVYGILSEESAKDYATVAFYVCQILRFPVKPTVLFSGKCNSSF